MGSAPSLQLHRRTLTMASLLLMSSSRSRCFCFSTSRFLFARITNNRNAKSLLSRLDSSVGALPDADLLLGLNALQHLRQPLHIVLLLHNPSLRNEQTQN